MDRARRTNNPPKLEQPKAPSVAALSLPKSFFRLCDDSAKTFFVG